jgi:hypothetical protein
VNNPKAMVQRTLQPAAPTGVSVLGRAGAAAPEAHSGFNAARLNPYSHAPRGVLPPRQATDLFSVRRPGPGNRPSGIPGRGGRTTYAANPGLVRRGPMARGTVWG